MPTKRSHTTALCTGTALIVAGGEGEGGAILSTVEVMNTENYQWSTAADLPQPMHGTSATVCGDRMIIYMLGGFYKSETSSTSASKSVYTCSVNALLLSCVPSSKHKKTPNSSVWRQVADLPLARSTCETFHGQATLRNGKTYVTKGGQYVRYSDSNAGRVDSGYPRPIQGMWGATPILPPSTVDSMP